MATSVKVGHFFAASSDVVGTTYAQSGFGFTPKAIIIWTTAQSGSVNAAAAANTRWGLGFAVSDVQRVCTFAQSRDAQAATDTDSMVRDDAMCGTLTSAGAVTGLIDLDSMDADGFTAIVDQQHLSNQRYYYIAIGGTDLTNAACGTWTEPAATGVQQIASGLGFTPTCAFLGGGQATALATRVDDHALFLGVMTSAAQWVMLHGENHGLTDGDPYSYARAGECAAMFDPAAAINANTTNFRASFSAFGAGTISINVAERAASRLFIYLALSGGSISVGSVNTRNDANPITITGTPTTPKGILTAWAGVAAHAADTPSNSGGLGMGAADSPSNRHAGFNIEENGAATTNNNAQVRFDAIACALTPGTTTTAWLMDLDSFDVQGATLVMDANDAGAPSFVGYVLFGDNALSPLTATAATINVTPGSTAISGSGLPSGGLGTFADFIDWPDRRVIVLAEATPSLTLENWTASGVNSWVLPIARFVQTAKFPGGVYRKVVGVQEDAGMLTARTSQALVDANAGSWFWDEAAGNLYVRTAAGGSPDNRIAMQAFVTFYFATTGIVLNQTDADPTTGIYYRPFMSSDNIKMASWIEDIVSGGKRAPGAEVVFSNGHGFFHEITAVEGPYNWANREIRFYYGGTYRGLALPKSQYAAIATMQVEDVAPDTNFCTFRLKPQSRTIQDVTVPSTPIFESEYPNVGPESRGSFKPIGYGRGIIDPPLVDASGLGVWLCADPAYQTLFRVNAVMGFDAATGEFVGLSEGLDFTVNLTACTITIINPAFSWQTHTLRVDVTGKPDGAGSYLKTFGQIAKDLLMTFLNLPITAIDVSSFDDASIEAPQELAVWLTTPRQLASILSTSEDGQPSLERSVLGQVQQTLSGIWTAFIWTPNYDASSLIELQRKDFAKFQPEPKVEAIFSRARVFYWRQIDNWNVAFHRDLKTQYLGASLQELNTYTFLRFDSDAQTLAQRLQYLSGRLSVEIEFEERGSKLATHLGGDKVLVTYSPAPTSSGAYNQQPFELLLIERSFYPTLKCSGRMALLTDVASRIGEWSDVAAPNWAAASPAQKLSQGFWSGTDGRIDPADATTKNRSVWW